MSISFLFHFLNKTKQNIGKYKVPFLIRQLDALKLLLSLDFFPLLREDHKNPLDFRFQSGQPIVETD